MFSSQHEMQVFVRCSNMQTTCIPLSLLKSMYQQLSASFSGLLGACYKGIQREGELQVGLGAGGQCMFSLCYPVPELCCF